jgi:hypothetical protein
MNQVLCCQKLVLGGHDKESTSAQMYDSTYGPLVDTFLTHSNSMDMSVTYETFKMKSIIINHMFITMFKFMNDVL